MGVTNTEKPKRRCRTLVKKKDDATTIWSDSSNEENNCHNEAKRKYAKMNCVNRRSSQDDILMTEAQLEAGKMRTDKKDVEKASEWCNSTYMHLERIPKYFIAEFFVDEGYCTAELCDKVDAKSAAALRELNTMFHGTADGAKLPRACLRKPVLKKFWRARGLILGKRWIAFFAEFVDEEGNINWLGGVYRFSWVFLDPKNKSKGKKVQKVHHITY